MTRIELEALISEALEDVIPEFQIKEDSSGQLIIATGLLENEEGDLVPISDNEDDDDDFENEYDLN